MEQFSLNLWRNEMHLETPNMQRRQWENTFPHWISEMLADKIKRLFLTGWNLEGMPDCDSAEIVWLNSRWTGLTICEAVGREMEGTEGLVDKRTAAEHVWCMTNRAVRARSDINIQSHTGAQKLWRRNFHLEAGAGLQFTHSVCCLQCLRVLPDSGSKCWCVSVTVFINFVCLADFLWTVSFPEMGGLVVPAFSFD